MLLTTVIQPTVDQVDQFGEATSRRNNADKVRNAVYPLFKLSFEQSNIALFQGNHWIVKATQTKRSGIDLHKLVETLAELGVKEPASLVESCREETVYPTFRAQPVPTL